MTTFYTPFGERSRRGRTKPQPRRRARPIEAMIGQKTRKEMTPNEIALDYLKKAFTPYHLTPEAIRQYQAEAQQLESLRYMNMETLAAALYILSRFEAAGINPALFADMDLIDYLGPYQDLLPLPEDEFERVTANLDRDLRNSLRTLRSIDARLTEFVEPLIPQTPTTRKERKTKAKPKQEEGGGRVNREELITRQKASILRYMRNIYFMRRERQQALGGAEYVAPKEEQLIMV